MLWWFIGFWLASGALLPAFLLLRMAYRWLAAPKLGPKGLHVLSGLVGIGLGAMILWIVCSFSDSSIAMRDTPSAFVPCSAAHDARSRGSSEADPIAAIGFSHIISRAFSAVGCATMAAGQGGLSC
jgi:hypothetical protein